jgi:peptidoglycan/xylan/chitin deacetylase (PgdA/CDA1 family)
MKTIVLKVDVDTLRGTQIGVPQLSALFQRYRAHATFLFSLGKDHTGRAIKRIFRPGFFQKVSRTSVVEHYGIRTLLNGTLLPGPDIGRRCASILRATEAAGFEVGIHCWDHVRWQDHVVDADERWTLHELNQAVQRFEEIFGHAVKTHGAAGWQMNAAAYLWQARMGLQYASDTRGQYPFQPVVNDAVLSCIQMPTTLPTLDELLGLNDTPPENVHERLLQATQDEQEYGHVPHL